MTSRITKEDAVHLAEAARIALKGRGEVEPNPMVGAVVAAEGRVIGRGYHARYGGPHAEVHALRRAGDAARGADLFVTLEPCSSRGKTPPCTEAILAAGIRRVVAGAVDPDPRHRGRGLDLLRAQGISCIDARDPACEALLRPFMRGLESRRPHVVLKWASTLDGRIAAADGSSRWISGPESRRIVHRLRGHCDGGHGGRRNGAHR